jgi:hypothetical protein
VLRRLSSGRGRSVGAGVVRMTDTTISLAAERMRRDLLPELSSFIGRVCSGYAPPWGVLRTQSV